MDRIPFASGSWFINLEPCDSCIHPEWEDSCSCRAITLCDCTIVLVYPQVFPIPTTPQDTTYIVRIWKSQQQVNFLRTINLHGFIYEDATLEIPLTGSVKPEDMEHLYVDMCKTHLRNVKFKIINPKKFKGCKPQNSYLLNLESRLKDLINSKERKTEDENPHISRRKKGHSHVRK